MNRSPTPVVSVVVPTYRHRHTVLATLHSVFSQTFADYEVIVVDDGSPDDTEALLRPLAQEGRIVYVRQENRGQGAARNRGIALARGEFVALLDDDDLWPPEKLNRQVAALRAAPQAVLAYGPALKLLPDGSLVPHKISNHPSGAVHGAFRRRNWIVSPGQTLIRTAALREIGSFDADIWGADDWDLYIRLAPLGEFVFDDRVTLHYRVHEGNASNQAVRHARNDLRVVRRHIGWNLPLLVAHQRAAAGYFVPNLLRALSAAQGEGDHAAVLRAGLYALSFRPTLLLRPSFASPLLASAWRVRWPGSTSAGNGPRTQETE